VAGKAADSRLNIEAGACPEECLEMAGLE
jgi:hypothetical protein